MTEAATFTEMGLDPLILKALEKIQYVSPSLVQAKAIPLVLQQKDVIALAQTGSGKTAACAIPICHLVDPAQGHVQALIIVPTRELALQYATEVQKIGGLKNVKAFAIYGGEDATMQQSKLKSGVQVLVATPGRLIDFIYSRSIDLSHVETLILDEADEMLSMGFYDDLEFIIQCLVHTHQTLLFSATMPEGIKKIAKAHLKDPIEIVLTKDQASPSKIDHHFLYCHHRDRVPRLIEMIHQLNPEQAIIFCHSRYQVEDVCQALKKAMPAVDFLHAGLTQDIRTIVTSKFRSGKIRFLVATDVAARGLDFSRITHVFIYQLSDDPDIYVHRSGRTGRFERKGMVVTLVTDRELKTLKEVLHKINQEPNWIGTPPPATPHPRPKGPRSPRRSR
jgi:ATP-dependent RNA helicase DeaD